MTRNPSGDTPLGNHHIPSDGVSDSVAIVGLSFSFPQEATSLESFWKLLMDGRGTATEFPQSRISMSNMYHPDQHRKGQVGSKPRLP